MSARGNLEERLADLLLGNKVRCFTKVELLADPLRWQTLFFSAGPAIFCFCLFCPPIIFSSP